MSSEHRYSNPDKAQFVLWYRDEGQSYVLFERRVRRELGRYARVPDHKTIRGWYDHFMEEGTVASRRSAEKEVTARTPENIQAVRDAVTGAPGLSIRRVAAGVGTSSSKKLKKKKF